MRKLILLVIITVFAVSCITQKKCNDKFPPVILEKEVYIHDTVNTKETIRDTTVIVKAGKDSIVYKSDTVKIKDGVVNSKPVITEGKYATATGQVINSKLIVKLEERSYDLEVKLKGALKDKETYKTYYEVSKEKQAITKEVKVGKFYVWFFYLSLIVILLITAWKNRGLIIRFIKLV
jgi:hypothetical protein